MMRNSLFGNYLTPLFVEVWGKAEDFYADYINCGIPDLMNDEDTVKSIFYLLYARYGNNAIASTDTNRWKYMVFSLIYQYGPTWAKKMDIQAKLRGLDLDDSTSLIYQGSRNINNHAYNPNTSPSTASLEELNYINEQHTNGTKRGYLDAAAALMTLLETDLTGEFLDKFRRLFSPIAAPQVPLYYTTTITNEEEIVV